MMTSKCIVFSVITLYITSTTCNGRTFGIGSAYSTHGARGTSAFGIGGGGPGLAFGNGGGSGSIYSKGIALGNTFDDPGVSGGYGLGLGIGIGHTGAATATGFGASFDVYGRQVSIGRAHANTIPFHRRKRQGNLFQALFRTGASPVLEYIAAFPTGVAGQFRMGDGGSGNFATSVASQGESVSSYSLPGVNSILYSGPHQQYVVDSRKNDHKVLATVWSGVPDSDIGRAQDIDTTRFAEATTSVPLITGGRATTQEQATKHNIAQQRTDVNTDKKLKVPVRNVDYSSNALHL